ncbi:uncharacterized protein LOC109824420 [Asparagus officinalis]|uniref:uncharacterized protein LOC109824420 n=1 Tax=Asparagus officinalis TaxID=4686 RepID=UPI00098E050D|nr:uncharacterized protein LOC109824420 [Asparagus officinalis]
MNPPSSSLSSQPPGLKTHFKTPEGRYKLQLDKTHPAGLLHFSHGKSVSQLTIACLKEKLATQTPTTPTTPSSSGVVRLAAARLLGAGNGSRALSFVGGNGVSKVGSGNGRVGGATFGVSNGSGGSSAVANHDEKGTYLIFNVGDTLFISDLNSQDKVWFSNLHCSLNYT